MDVSNLSTVLENAQENDQSDILYELLIFAEWQQDPEVLGKAGHDKNEDKQIRAGLWSWMSSWTKSPIMPALLENLNSHKMAWQFAMGGEGRMLAILQDQSIEIRSSRDEYGTVIRRCIVPKDQCPYWRKLLWSPDCTMLAFAQSNGVVEIFDCLGTSLFTLQQNNSVMLQYLNEAVAGMAFIDSRTRNTKWTYEFLVVTYSGHLQCYLVSPTDGYQTSHKFSFHKTFSRGISAITYHPHHDLLFVSGTYTGVSLLKKEARCWEYGIVAWRLLSDFPHYKMVTSSEDEMALNKLGFLQNFSLRRFWGQHDCVYKLSISPDSSLLAAVYTSGILALWHLPSLRLKGMWEVENQPDYDKVNPYYLIPGKKKKAELLLTNPFMYHILDINWWSEKCESQISSKKRALTSENEEVEESSDEEELSLVTRSARTVKKALYIITDNERFQPPRKKPKFITRTYRLLCLKSTTPEELYTRKIDAEEYGEALALAKTYGLDCDLVYQRQWRKHPVSIATIQDYLSKITKRSWVLHECSERVPESIDATKELLQYGLQGTNLEALIAIGKGEDSGRFIVSQSDRVDALRDHYESEEEIGSTRKAREQERRQELWKQIDFSNLNLEQKQLCQCRMKLLKYLDRLSTYEIILGGPHIAEEHYDAKFFKVFRSQSGLEGAVQFARESDWRSVAAMFTYHGKETLQHHLPVLSNFPETTSPFDYRSLLPESGCDDDEPEIYPWEEVKRREDDWCETENVKELISPDFAVEFYEDHPELQKFCMEKLTKDLLTQWYDERARQIEQYSQLVDNALELVQLGLERNVKGLEKLLDDLETMETLVYSCHMDKKLSFEELEKMNSIEKLNLMMSMSDEENFVKNVKQWLLPFLSRCEKHQSGSQKTLLKEYLIGLAVNDLKPCLKIFQSVRKDSDPIIGDIDELITLALNCVYICERNDQLNYAFLILDCLPQRGSGGQSKKLDKLHDKVDQLEKHLSVAEIFEKNGNPMTLGYICKYQDNPEIVKQILVQLTRKVSHRVPALTESQWRALLLEMLDMQQHIFPCITAEDCYEIFTESLLCSGSKENISLAGQMLESSHNVVRKKSPLIMSSQTSGPLYSNKVPYHKAVKLVLVAAQEYFNSSATLSDPCMALAKTSLQLLQDVPPSIEDELDLISSLSLLDEFSVNILPLQVRQCQNRLELVQKALLSKPGAYKQPQKVLKLAHLLRVCGNNKKECEGKTLSLLAESAFQAADYEACYGACHRLLNGCFREGWKVCQLLGQCQEFKNLSARIVLLTFAISYCASDLLEDLLRNKAEIQLQMIYSKVESHLNQDKPEVKIFGNNSFFKDENRNSETNFTLNTLHQTHEATLEILRSTTETTKAVFSSVTGAQIWKDTAKWINSLSFENEIDAGLNAGLNTVELNKYCASTFYASLFEDCHIGKIGSTYTRYAFPDLSTSFHVPISLVHAALLESTLKETHNSEVSSEVLLELVQLLLQEDTTLGIAFLLGLSQPEEADELFKRLPRTALVLQLASYYFALQLYASIQPVTVLSDDFYIYSPRYLIKQVVHVLDTDKVTNFGKLKCCASLLRKYNKLLFDFIEAEILKTYGGGVDVARFTQDDIYKHETILGLAMTLEKPVLHVAVSLAHKYGLPLWDIYMTHLEFLFTDTSLTTLELESRLKELRMHETLTSEPEKMCERLQEYVYPSIDGTDHSRLFFYYSLLEECGNVEDCHRLTPSSHLKTLKKLKSACPRINYKDLLEPMSSQFDELYKALTEGNVHVFAKLAPKIPSQDGKFLTSSNIFRIWSIKYFFESCQRNKTKPKTLSQWISHFSSCEEFYKRLTPEDYLECINVVTFSKTALKMFSFETRYEITRKAEKFVQTKTEEKEESQKWAEVLEQLRHNFEHFKRLEDEIVVEMKTSTDANIYGYAEEFDLSRSVPEKVRVMLLRAVMEAQPISLLQNLLALCPPEMAWEPMDAFTESITLVTEQLRNPDKILHPTLQKSDPLNILDAILKQLSDNTEELLTGELALEVLRPFCNDSSVPVSLRLRVLQLLEKTVDLLPEDSALLLLFRTQVVITDSWPDFHVQEEKVLSEEGRQELFDILLNKSENIKQITTLSDVLNCWPSLILSDPGDDVWSRLILKLLSFHEFGVLEETVKLLKMALLRTSFTLKCGKVIYEEVQNHGSYMHSLKVALLLGSKEMQDEAISLLNTHIQMSENDYDEELLSLLLHKHLVPHTLATNLYGPIIKHLLNIENEERRSNVECIVRELYDTGHRAEAGSLLLLSNNLHHALSTFGTALGVLQRFIHRI
ncbi:NBAS subunit of NRZ tethering complex-like isoform X3 [Tachypleus tridentatus]|uniref:NBAS subunit of NRZ tethering complex-like isoform X3 n=1 Tax=Tachypleus tridentatus TaxID=6853 RepID=UPI003FD3CFEC